MHRCLRNSKALIMIGIIIMFSLSLAAEFVHPTTAVELAANWMNYWQSEKSFAIKEVLEYRQEDIRRSDLRGDFAQDHPELYIVYFENGSFSVVPADDNLRPVLAYSSLPLSDASEMPPAFKMWLEFYAQDVRYVRESGDEFPENRAMWDDLAAAQFRNADRDREISPLLKTLWNQNWPYNELCPEDADGPGGRVYVGCVATAMAQVMKYWNSPITGVGSKTYYAYPYGYQTANFGATTYLWDEMPNSVGSSNIPVATLSYHAAVGVEMGFSPNGSGSNGTRARAALRDYFRYPNASYVRRDDYASSTWENMLKAQLDNGVPMYYSGMDTDAGHAWNLDGYQGSNYFHFNFGWGGSYNGYYYLTSITPGSNNFNSSQAAITNAIPQGYSMADPRIQIVAENCQAGDPFRLSMTTYPVLGSWDIQNYDFTLYYEVGQVEYLGVSLDGTISEGGDIVVDASNPGYVQVSWNRSEALFGGGKLIDFNFRSIEPGTNYFGTIDMAYEGTILQNVEPLLMDVDAPVADLESSTIAMTNAMHIGHNQLATIRMNSSYLPPSWNVTHYDFRLAFDPDLVEFADLDFEGCISVEDADISIDVSEPGILEVSYDSDAAISGINIPLVKILFRAIGNSATAQLVNVTLSDFYYNDTQITSTSNAIIVLSPVTSIDEEIPAAVSSLANYPNPFNPTTSIDFYLAQSGKIDAAIYNLRGQRIFTLHEGEMRSGNHRFVWSGTDDQGRELSSGIYLIRITGAERQLTKKLSLVK